MENNNTFTLDFKLDKDKIEAIKKQKTVSSLKEAFNFLYESFEKAQCWKDLTEFQRYCIVENAFIFYFTNFPTRMQIFMMLIALDEDKTFNSFSDEKKISIRNIIKHIGLTLKFTAKNKNLTLSIKDAEEIKKLLDEGIDKQLFIKILGSKLWRKLAKKWGKYQI